MAQEMFIARGGVQIDDTQPGEGWPPNYGRDFLWFIHLLFAAASQMEGDSVSAYATSRKDSRAALFDFLLKVIQLHLLITT